MLQKVIEILESYVEDGVEITLESNLVTDLGLGSLDVVGAVGDFEDEFDIEIPERIIPKLATVGDIVSFLEDCA